MADVVVIGNGPSALILSYLLHGNVPYYTGRHHDVLLHSKLQNHPCLLDINSDLYAHLQLSMRYSSQALPINILLDTLLRPNADFGLLQPSCIEWRHDPACAVPHVVLGSSPRPGGQWADESLSAYASIGALSYAEMLSLPGHSFAEYYFKKHGRPMPELQRPLRAEVSQYYASYPTAVGISESIKTSTAVEHVERAPYGFRVYPQNIFCKRIILATGVSGVIPPPPFLSSFQSVSSNEEALIVVGSGFSAADAIISCQGRKIIHLYQWAPEDRPSPLRACQYQTYPEYAYIYRQMKIAALSSSPMRPRVLTLKKQKSNPSLTSRTMENTYQGFPNAEIVSVSALENGKSRVRIRLESCEEMETTVGDLEYHVGRRGSLSYLSRDLLDEVFRLSAVPETDANGRDCFVSGASLRTQAETGPEVAPEVFIVGSLAGDVLMRYAYGTCVFVAGKIISRHNKC